MNDDASFFDDEDPTGLDASCRHWQSRGACLELCACGHGCSEHHEAGWCGRCACPAWVDGPEARDAPAAVGDDAWELTDLFPDEQEDYDDAAGF